MASYQNTKYFYSYNGTETQNLHSTSSRSSAESCVPTQETLEAEPSHPWAKPYATSAEAQMWNAVDVLQQLEIKLRPIYDSLMHRNVIQEKSELLEQQNKIMQACEIILESITVIERKLAQVSDLPTAGAQGVTHSWCPNQHFREFDTYIWYCSETTSQTLAIQASRLSRFGCEAHDFKSSDECLSLPEVLLVRADDCRTLAGVQLDGQPTCAFVVSRNDYQKIEQLLKDKSIRNIRYCIGFCGENMPVLPSAAGVTDHFELKKEWFEDDNETVRSKIVERNNEERVEKTGLWSAVASILEKRDDAGSVMVRVKDVKEAYEEKQQLETKMIQLNNTVDECNKLMEEKQQVINDLRGILAQTSGHLENEQGQVSEIICQNEKIFELLNRKLPDAVSIAENNRPAGNTQPQRTGQRVPKATRQQLSASSQCPKLGSQLPQENKLFNETKEERLFKTTPNNSFDVTDHKPINFKPDATFTSIKLESSSTGSCGGKSAKGEVKTIPKPLEKVKFEDKSLCGDKIKAKPMQTTKSAAKSDSGSGGGSSIIINSNSSSNSKKSSSTTVTANPEQSKTSLTDGEGNDTEKPTTDSIYKIEDMKQQVRSDVPKNKTNAQSQSNLSLNDVGTSVDP